MGDVGSLGSCLADTTAVVNSLRLGVGVGDRLPGLARRFGDSLGRFLHGPFREFGRLAVESAVSSPTSFSILSMARDSCA
jgi:hypothetical protein